MNKRKKIFLSADETVELLRSSFDAPDGYFYEMDASFICDRYDGVRYGDYKLFFRLRKEDFKMDELILFPSVDQIRNLITSQIIIPDGHTLKVYAEAADTFSLFGDPACSYKIHLCVSPMQHEEDD